MFFKKPVSSSLLAWEAAVLANVKDTAGIIYYRFSRRHWVGAFNLHRYNPVLNSRTVLQASSARTRAL